ncbi:VPLPA-CTERM-specific exosortase XrtD [Bradyrhizobium sp. STM 3843]|uniref:VPLPA-CTERM-specific exosortase XrtD n=1 Tax=Bradyrhizobium sp. STM 3843 TaxID=551947 RepID=UPI0002E8434A|nr:VPLPA-CTERM-specific exosortase XrtD [Bradyrhizobium sp. STM 3843]
MFRTNLPETTMLTSWIEPSERAWVRTRLLALATLILALFAFRDALLELVRRWTTQEEYGHGFLIPLITAWLLWSRREALHRCIGRPSWAGVALVAFALAMHFIGQLSAIFLFSQLAFIVTLFGITLAFGGFSLFRAAFWPIAFLVFAIPLPYFIDAALSLQLQLISSRLGVFLIRLLDIPVLLDGNIVDLGVYKLQVVDACSGLRYLFPLLSLSFLAAYIFRAPLWQRVVVLLSCAPITVIMNGFRIALIGVTVDRWGAQMAEGALHFFEGWVIFVACATLLAAEMYVLSRLSGHAFSLSLPENSGINESSVHRPALQLRSRPLAACLSLVFLLLLASPLVAHRPENIPARGRFLTFPGALEGWQGRPSVLEPEVEQTLALDDYILSDYAAPGGEPVNLYVAYYASQRMGESPHSPLVCIPGSGWLITHFQRTRLDADHPFNRAIVERNGQRQLVYYWYDERGRQIANEYISKAYLLYDALTLNRSDGALVRLTTIIRPSEFESDADARLRLFINALMPQLKQYLATSKSSQNS